MSHYDDRSPNQIIIISLCIYQIGSLNNSQQSMHLEQREKKLQERAAKGVNLYWMCCMNDKTPESTWKLIHNPPKKYIYICIKIQRKHQIVVFALTLNLKTLFVGFFSNPYNDNQFYKFLSITPRTMLFCVSTTSPSKLKWRVFLSCRT